ncbi:MAG: NADH-quinone oxidoreductase subunit J [Anaerolineae bacterium]|nr:NADH-quinone oxidoreductase subunit J [Anaerolineae bacterium]
MTLVQIVFLVLAVAAIGSAVGVVTSKNIFYSALLLIACLFMVAGFYVLLEAPFLAAVQVLIYVGAIAVLIIFAVMLTENLMVRRRAWNEQWWVALVVAAALAAVLLYVVVTAQWQVSAAATPGDAIAALGQSLMSTYVLPFEVASVLLLMALIGAIIIAREEKEEQR